MNRPNAFSYLMGAGIITMTAFLFGSASAQMKTASIDPSPIGIVDEVRNDAFGILPNRTPERLYNTASIFFDERIETSVNALSRLLFIDDTTLTVGPNSSMVLDRFVYNPKTAKGEILMHMATGVFRFASGKMPKESVTLVTPGASIGIRGTDFITEVLSDGGTRVSVFEGRVILTPHGGESLTLNPGQVGIIAAGAKVGKVENCPDMNCTAGVEQNMATRDLVTFGRPRTHTTQSGELKNIEPTPPNPAKMVKRDTEMKMNNIRHLDRNNKSDLKPKSPPKDKDDDINLPSP